MNAKKIIAPARERLKKLYEVGKPVTFTDDEGEFSVWLQKITPFQEKQAIESSYAPRAATLALLKNEDDPARLAFMDTLEQWGLDDKEAQVNFLITPDVQKAERSIQLEIASHKEWADDDYLISLQAAWNEGLDEKFALDPEDIEASRVFAELKRYTEEVEFQLQEEREVLFDVKNAKSEESLLRDVLRMLVEHQAGQDQMAEYHKWEIYFATRLEEDHNEFFFQNRQEVDEWPELYSRLLEEYIKMTVDSIEGKD